MRERGTFCEGVEGKRGMWDIIIDMEAGQLPRDVVRLLYLRGCSMNHMSCSCLGDKCTSMRSNIQDRTHCWSARPVLHNLGSPDDGWPGAWQYFFHNLGSDAVFKVQGQVHCGGKIKVGRGGHRGVGGVGGDEAAHSWCESSSVISWERN